jgi:Sortase domain
MPEAPYGIGRARGRVSKPAALLLAVLAGGLLAGCGGGDEGPAKVLPPVGAGVPTWGGEPIAQTPFPHAAWAAPLSRSAPEKIKIPRLGVSAPVGTLGLRSDGRIEEPPLSRPNLAGWYKGGPSPGEAGPAVILGHVDANRQRAVFYRLSELQAGDRVEVTREDGRTAVFAVQEVRRVAKAKFPAQQVYAEDLDYPSLRLITCGGAFNPSTGHYVDNVIAFTRMVSG